MAPKLTDEQRQALASHPSEPVVVEDPQNRTQYVLLRLDVFRNLQRLAYDDSEVPPSAFYPAFAAAVKEDVDAPGMDEYDQYDAHRKQP
jgi:hypothetical protein